MAAVTPDETPYFDDSAWEHARHRVVWLLILMLSAAITGSIITRYEDAISAVPLLVAFLPMLMDTGGNCGSQSATLVLRGLALEEIRPRDALRVIRKELAVAAIVSAVLAAANGLRIYLQYHDSADVYKRKMQYCSLKLQSEFLARMSSFSGIPQLWQTRVRGLPSRVLMDTPNSLDSA